MPTIEEGIKLDFKDVLLRPKRSTLKSRIEVWICLEKLFWNYNLVWQVDLNKTYKFRNSGQEYSGVPLIAANMDTIGTFEMALSLNKVIRISRF